jgi:CRISPR-associated exonuclease Cas4
MIDQLPGPQPPDDEDFQPIRALNDLLFCERRCALHRIEQIWVDNVFTLEGTHQHRRADKLMAESPRGVRCLHGVLLRSTRLRLSGKADIVEFHPGSPSPLAPLPQGATGESEVPFPVEYKRGRRRRWDNDDVQLCAQALCLEEMLGVAVPAGAVFHAKTRRRREVTFTADLRALTEKTARRLHELFAAGCTPLPVLKPRCRGCSLREFCFPQTLERPYKVKAYCRQLFIAAPDL